MARLTRPGAPRRDSLAVAAASGAASVRLWHITSRGWDPWTERPLPEGVRVAYPHPLSSGPVRRLGRRSWKWSMRCRRTCYPAQSDAILTCSRDRLRSRVGIDGKAMSTRSLTLKGVAMSSWLRQPPLKPRADVASRAAVRAKPALFEGAERSVPSRIAEALARVDRAGRAGVVLIAFSNDRRGA